MTQTRDSSHITTGISGEDIACKFLIAKAFKIIDRNWRYKNHHEIDIIALSTNGAYVAVEVRSHKKEGDYEPFESITPSKINRIKSALAIYALQNSIDTAHLQVDVISVIIETKRITHFESVDATI